MKQLKIESNYTRQILRLMQKMANEEICTKKKNETGVFLTALTWYPEKKVLVATDSLMLLIWKVNDSELLKELCYFTEISFFCYDVSSMYLCQIRKPDKFRVINYKKLIPPYEHYVNLKELDKTFMKQLGVSEYDIMLEYACICSGTRFRSLHFERLVSIAEWDIMEFMKDKKNCPVEFKSKESRLIALVMPLSEMEMKIYKKE